jgi:hypothetical protein
MLLSIYHTDIGPPTTLYFVNNYEDITHQGNVYTAFPFQIMIPADFDDQLPRVQLSIDNIDRSIIEELRGIVGPPTITVTVVLADDDSLVYDTVEAGPFELALRNIDYNAMVITGDLQSEDILNEPYPGYFYTPANFPGLWI